MTDPWLKFYPTDWRSDPKLRMCGLPARGLWIELISIMHEATPYGHLLVSGIAPTDTQLAVLVGAPSDQIPGLVGELEAAGVFSRTREGVIYSRRMTRMVKKAAELRKAGQKGGNPKLLGEYRKPGYVYAIGRRNDGAVKIGVSVNPSNRIKKIREQYRGHDLHILGSVWTDDMGTLEGTLHKDLAAKNAGGEWFHLDDKDLKTMGFLADHKGATKADPLPQKPEAIYQTASQLGAGAKLYDRLIDAASSRGTCHEKLAMGIGPITDLIAKGYDLETDILPIIREKAGPTVRSWTYFVTIIVQRHAERQAIPSKAAPKAIDWEGRVRDFYEHDVWGNWGPRPGDPGCRAPSEFIRKTAA